MRRAATIDFVNHTESDLHAQGIRDQFPMYLRPINRIAQTEFDDRKSSNWGYPYTYDHTRWAPHVSNYNGRNRRRESDRAFPRRNRQTQYVRCAVGDQDGQQGNWVLMMKNRIILTIMGALRKGKYF